LSGSISTANDRIRILPRLVDARSGERVWATTYDKPFSADGVWQVVDSVAAAVVAAVGEPYGPLFDAEVARTIPAGTSIDPYHCLLRFVFALQVVSEGAHARATTCFEQAVEAEPDSSMSWARLAALYRMEYLHGFNAKPGAPPALDRATDAARRALELDANNAFGHQEMAFLCLLRDDYAGFEDAVARTLALKPSADIRAALGINFVKMGEVERGRALIDAAIADSPRAPPFFFLGYAVDALRMHDYAAAYSWAQRMATRDWPLSQAFLAATAALAGKPDRSREAAARLRDLRPPFAATGRDLIARGRLGREVEAQLFRGLALAGVPLN
jgi:Tfp pilus assembly protein PilF